MWILLGIIAAIILWKLFKLTVMGLFLLLVIGVILGAIPMFRKRTKNR
ncbi:hypothetical protein [Aneurinibacillus uraniidurans]|nr:hypothetical protein [Aneurinibacillus sp. B1]WCN39359.1 hypothetical protein PO771_08195 [Aneurinibacillus sp. B1]